MKKTLILTAAFACAAFTANAALLVDSWYGDIWSYTEQPNYGAADRTINDNAGSGASIWVSTTPIGTGMPNGHLGGDYFYTFMQQPTLTFRSGTVGTGVTQIKLELLAGGNNINLETSTALLSLDGATGIAVSSYTKVDAEGVDNPFSDSAYLYTYVWDIDSLVNFSDFSIDVSFVEKHVALFEATLTQVVVPEPSTYALIAGGLGLVTVVAIRRRRRA